MRQVFAALAALALAACSSTYVPPQARDVKKSTVVGAPAEKVWQTVIRYFAENNIPIENLDHSSFFIKTKPVDLTVTFAASSYAGKKIPLKNQWCDCGDAKIANVWSSSQRILLSFNIVLRSQAEDTTDAGINVFFDGVKLGKRNAYASGYDIEMPLQCVSTGKLEQDLLRYLAQSASES